MIRISHMLLIALFICISSARDHGRLKFDWRYDGDLTMVLDFANEYFENDSKFVIFGSYAAHLASNGMLQYNDVDVVLLQPNDDSGASVNLFNRTVINYHGKTIDLKVGSVASLDDLLDASNINAVSVAFEFEKVGRDDIRLFDNLKDVAFDEFRQTRVLRILEPEKATANDCIRLLAKAERYKFQYDLDRTSRMKCTEPQILSSEKSKMARPEITGRDFANRVFDIEGTLVWARSLDEAETYLQQSGGRRGLWWDSEDDHPVQGYYDEGDGKCVTDAGADPSHVYFHGIGEEQCRLKCDHESACWGFSVSTWGNCLHWMQNDIKAGGASWGGAKCWIAQGVIEQPQNGRRNLKTAQNLVSKDRRLLNASDRFALSSGFYDVGLGKCVTSSGGDPSFNYLHGIGEDACRTQCSMDFHCKGFSVSIYGNCLHWTTDDLQESGGPSWGGAHCWIAQSVLDARSGRRKN